MDQQFSGQERLSQKRLKVALVADFPADPSVPKGGVQAVVANLTEALINFDDLEVHVVTLTRHVSMATRKKWNNVTIHYLPYCGRWTLSSAVGANRKQICHYLRELVPSIVHAHDTYGLMVKGLPIPRVFTIHGFIYGDTLVSGEKFALLRSRIWHYIETSGWADQPHIISISPYVRERLAGIATGVIYDIDNPIAESFFSIPRQEKKGVVFSAALICPRKNTLALIDAFARLRTMGIFAELRLAGPVTDEIYYQQIRERIRNFGLEKCVTLLGNISRDRVAQELAAASVFALVSLEENSPMGIAEAMAVGIPVVSSNRCGIPYMVRHGETGFLVNPHDPEDTARRLQLLLDDDSLRLSMGEKARQIAGDRFHPSVVARRTREVYLEAVQFSRLGTRSKERFFRRLTLLPH